ncbi:MAG: hypothetical protein UV79_C0003G0030 [candidate division TM6 bacterium GW2011_GWF2_43_17]|nr:MAG: hypothetical protein UV79_C0003G0030 [candidate division TM6 bacterium GW2011_GWF2_43_17]HAU30429.1 hypothetical protein [Candidatus Dependentiae bacterium]
MAKRFLLGMVIGFEFFCMCIGQGLELPVTIPVQSPERAVDRIDSGTKMFAAASTGALFTLLALGVERVSEAVVAKVNKVFPKPICCFAPAVGLLSSLVSTSCLLVKYREVVWYANAIVYSGKRLSPYIAHEILGDLRSYVRYLEALKNMQVEMEVLLAEVVDRGGSFITAGDLAKKIGQVVEEGELYVRNVCRRLEELGLYEEEGLQVFVHGAQEYGLEPSLRIIEGLPQSLELDTEVFDRLVADLLAYWQAYLESLMSHIEDKMTLCQRVLLFEHLLSGTLKKPLQAPVVVG